MICFASVDLHIQTTGHLLYWSIPIRIYGSPVACLQGNSQEKSFCIACPGTANTGSLIFSIDGNWYFEFLPELTNAVHVMHISSMSFLIPKHQNLLLCASFFVEAGCPKRSAFTIVSSVLLGSQFCHMPIANRIVLQFCWKPEINPRGLFLSACFSHIYSVAVFRIKWSFLCALGFSCQSKSRTPPSWNFHGLRRSIFSVFQWRGWLEYSVSSFRR